MREDLKQKNLFEPDTPEVSESIDTTSIMQRDSKIQHKDEYWWERYSLYRSGWHRFWFAMFITTCSVFGIVGNLPSKEGRIASQLDFQKIQRQQCDRICAPKSGYVTNEPLNPMIKPPNNVGRDGPRLRCNCS
jgi:hypothetical protein